MREPVPELDWSALATDYFEPVCRATFDAYFERQGFRLVKSDATAVRYGCKPCWLELHHYVEDAPRFSPMLTIGLTRRWSLTQSLLRMFRRGPRPPAIPAGFDSIGLWYAIPESEVQARYELWLFSSRDELEAIGPRLRDDIVDVYARPLWTDPDRLATLIVDRYRSYLEERERDRQPPDPRKGFAFLHQREEEIRRAAQSAQDK
ncbi:MAG TPA: hypothetical protein VEC11_13635 [Allosphingosinicella sp.]|nr:hypothetical protein [Allosphingosinicella sp.]